MVGVLKFRFAVPAGGGFPVFSSQALELLMVGLSRQGDMFHSCVNQELPCPGIAKPLLIDAECR
ncbi:hypothetical protein NC653_014211 [Populus alba x Populus x berolinensis]|uniref:Uncharacterized protein n=1 Tax=Populus alba x Populus x berolinensis TaxID=444605 RepID=A0AAD6W3K8_9ROSI|nr:hypothetical protein NC653_014211 [Populus alba x Populus x berolinensis]